MTKTKTTYLALVAVLLSPMAMAGIGSLVVDLGAGADGVQSLSFGAISSVPEPGTLALFGLGLAAMGFARK